MELKRKIRKAAELGIGLTAIATLILAGCGGGGGTSGGGAATSATITPFKGPFSSGATVTLKDANGNLVSLISGGTINASGVADVTYSANVTYPLIVEVTGSYYNENTGAMETATVPLRGLISSAGAASSVPVTIVTETAVADLQTRLGSFAPAHPIQAASAVAALNVAGAMLGIPASAVPAFNPATHQTSDRDTLRLAAWAVVANGLTGTTLLDRVRALANSLAALNPASAPVDVIGQAAYDSALTAMTNGGASSVMAAGTTTPTPPAIPTANHAALYASAVAAASVAAGGNSGGGGAGGGSAIGTGLYTAVTAQDSSGFLSLLNTACTTKTVISGGTDYSNCTQPANASYATNLVANMWMGGLPHQTGGSIVGGPSSYAPGTAKVNSTQGSMAGVAVNDSCTVSIAEPYIPIVLVEAKGARYYATGINFNFNGTADDTISVTSGGVVSQYTMTNGQGGKIEVHPNLALFNAGSGTEAVVGDVSFANNFICK